MFLVVGGSVANFAAIHSKSGSASLGSFPFALPNLISSILLFGMSIWVLFGLEEVSIPSKNIYIAF